MPYSNYNSGEEFSRKLNGPGSWADQREHTTLGLKKIGFVRLWRLEQQLVREAFCTVGLPPARDIWVITQVGCFRPFAAIFGPLAKAGEGYALESAAVKV